MNASELYSLPGDLCQRVADALLCHKVNPDLAAEFRTACARRRILSFLVWTENDLRETIHGELESQDLVAPRRGDVAFPDEEIEAVFDCLHDVIKGHCALDTMDEILAEEVRTAVEMWTRERTSRVA